MASTAFMTRLKYMRRKRCRLPPRTPGSRVEPQLDPGAALLHHVAVDHVSREVLEVVGDVEDLVDVLPFLLERGSARGGSRPRRSSGGSSGSGSGTARSGTPRGRKDSTWSIRPHRGLRMSSHIVPDRLDVAAAGDEDGLVRREVLDRAGVVLEASHAAPAPSPSALRRSAPWRSCACSMP